MKLTKRFLCLLLSLCTVFLAIPAFTFPIAAAESVDSSAKNEEPITISFRLSNERGAGAVGTLIAERTVKPGFVTFDIPTAEECLLRGVNANDILGWYSIDTNGVFRDAAAYSGTYIGEDLVFYPYLRSSSLSFDNDTNFPMYDDTGVTNFRGGWQFGHMTANGFVPFTVLSSISLAQATLGTSWTHGCVWLTHRNGQGVMGLSKTKGYVTTLSWTALVDGKVDLDFNEFSFLTSKVTSDGAGAYVAVAHNDTIIWPAALAGQKLDVSNSDFTGYSKVSCNTPAETVMTKVEIPGATCEDLAVKGGDTIRFIVGRDNVAEVMLNATVTYTETTDNYGDQVISSMPAYQPGKPLEGGQKFVETGTNDPDDANAEISYPGAWEMIVYDTPADIDDRKSALIDHYTTQNTAKRAFLTAYKDYGAAANAPVLVNHEASVLNGQDYSFLFNINSKAPQTPAAVGGYRYTAEHTGYIQTTFDKLNKDVGSYSLTAASFTEVRIAIFVDGVMVWPTANGDATDYANWCAPYSVSDNFVEVPANTAPVEGTDYTNQRDAINEQLKDLSFFVSKGSQIDFLITYASYVKAYPRTTNVFLPAVSYDTVVQTGFTASAALGTNLALNFSADATTGSFLPSTNNTYLKADTLKLTLSGGAENFRFDAVTGVENGTLTATVSNIAAKQMTETMSYVLTVEAQKPNNTTEQLTIAEGSISVASYMKALYDATPAGDVGMRDLILATLQYGAAAQTYFGYKTDALATDGINGEVSFTLPAAVDNIAQSGNGAYTFFGAALRLEDTIQLKLLLDDTNDAYAGWSSLYLKVNGQPANAKITLYESNEYGTLLQAVLDVPFAELATDYTITLHAADGTQVSSTLTYSVETYAARTANLADQADLLAAIRAVGQAALNYKPNAPTPDGEVVTRLVFISDSHIGSTSTHASEKLAAQLAQIKEWNKTTPIDVIVFTGDMLNTGTNSEYKEFIRILTEANLPDTIDFTFVLGNHEFYVNGDSKGEQGGKVSKPTQTSIDWAFKVFNENFADVYHVNGEGETKFTVSDDGMDYALRLDNGTYLIGLSIRGEGSVLGYNEKTEEFLVEAVKKAVAEDPTQPILIASHVGYGEINGDEEMKLSVEAQAFLNQYPQIVWLSGHTHYALQDPTMIQQKNFTNIQLPTAGSRWWWGTDSDRTSPLAYAEEANQGLILTISDTDVIYAERYDFGTNEKVGQDWRIDIPAILRSTDNFTYRVADRAFLAKAPEFAADAALTVEQLTSTTVTIKTPLATINDAVSDNAIEYYTIVITDMDNNIIYVKEILSEYYRANRANPYMAFSVSGLNPGTEYKVYVGAQSIFQKLSAALTTTFTTPVA